MNKILYVFWNDCVLSGRIMKTWLVGTNPHSYELPSLTVGNTQEEAISIAQREAKRQSINSVRILDKFGVLQKTMEVAA